MTKLLTYYSLGIFLLFFIVSCENYDQQKIQAVEQSNEISLESNQKFAVNTSSSEIAWEGSKPLGKHNGVVTLTDGQLHFMDGVLNGGSFNIDMNSIVNLDLDDPAYNQKLVAHLKSPDFFDVVKYPLATFVITKSDPISYTQETISGEDKKELPNYRLHGNLEMKDVKKAISFDVLIHLEGDSLWARSIPFSIDRTEWNVKYNSGKLFENMKDKVIDDQIGLKVNLIAHQIPDKKLK